MKRLEPTQPCPCGGVAGRADVGVAAERGHKVPSKAAPARPYGKCCGRWLELGAALGAEAQLAPDAELLMRSRYTAFVLEREPYLRSTWHASHRPLDVTFDPDVKWLGLEVRDYRTTRADTAEVEFVARQKPQKGPATRLHERSRFVLEEGRWWYVDGLQI